MFLQLEHHQPQTTTYSSVLKTLMAMIEYCMEKSNITLCERDMSFTSLVLFQLVSMSK